MTACYLIVAAYAVWTCNSTRFDDGIVGKILYCGLALAAIALCISPGNPSAEKALTISITAVCCRSFVRHTIYPHLFNKYPKLDRRNHGKNATDKSADTGNADHPAV